MIQRKKTWNNILSKTQRTCRNCSHGSTEQTPIEESPMTMSLFSNQIEHIHSLSLNTILEDKATLSWLEVAYVEKTS